MKQTRFFYEAENEERLQQTALGGAFIPLKDTENNSATWGQLGGSPGIYRPGFKTISRRMGVVLKTRG